jgi:hypothetical protein
MVLGRLPRAGYCDLNLCEEAPVKEIGDVLLCGQSRMKHTNGGIRIHGSQID